MLVLSRNKGEQIVLLRGDEVLARIEVVRAGDRVRLGFTADDDIRVLRSELLDTYVADAKEASV